MGYNNGMDVERAYEQCTEQLATFARKAGFGECVVGLSGGLDSSVVAALCAEAFGVRAVHGVLMPGPYSSNHSIEDAQELANALDIDPFTIPITEPYQAFADALAPACGNTFEGIASENTQARCRMVVLMALSNQHGWMVVNTGNRSEAYMGYSTLYGDTAGAFAPIGGLYKTQVYELGHYMNERATRQGGLAPIPQRVFNKSPSAELAPNQTDQDGLGIDYPTLDAILAAHFDEGKSAAELEAGGFAAEQVDYVLDRASRNTFKRAFLPPCACI